MIEQSSDKAGLALTACAGLWRAIRACVHTPHCWPKTLRWLCRLRGAWVSAARWVNTHKRYLPEPSMPVWANKTMQPCLNCCAASLRGLLTLFLRKRDENNAY